MAPVIPCSMSNISLIPLTALSINKNNCLTRPNSARKPTKHTLSAQRFVLPLPCSIRYFSQHQREYHRRSGVHILSATEVDVAVEKSDSPVADEDPVEASDTSSNVGDISESSSAKSDANPTSTQSKRSKPARKSEMPPVKNEELIPGATFTGRVRSIQPFGAFIDFGAFTDGLVHVSRLSDSFVKDVGAVVSVGQEVKVQLIEANTETGRISLTMRERDDISKLQQQKDAPASTEKARPARRSNPKPSQRRDGMKTTKFVKGQDLEGTVKNLTRSGAFISLPEGEEGFLPSSEESDDGLANMLGSSSLQVGQEVSVRVLRIARGQVTLTMKKEEDTKLDAQLSQGVVHVATNPFVLAFRKNKEIATFLDEREKADKQPEKPLKEIEGKANQSQSDTDIPQVEDQPAGSEEGIISVPSAVDETIEDNGSPSKEEVGAADNANDDENPASIVSDSIESTDGSLQTLEKVTEETTESLSSESLSTENQIIEETSSNNLFEEISGQVLSSENPKDGEVIGGQTDNAIAKGEVQIQTPSAESEVPSTAPVDNEAIGKNPDDAIAKDELQIETLSAESEAPSTALVEDEAVGQNLDDAIAKDELQIETSSTESEIPSAALVEDEAVGQNPDDTIAKEELQIETPSVESEIPSAAPVEDETVGQNPDDVIAKDELQTETPSAESEIPSAALVEDEAVGQNPDDAIAKDELQIETPSAESEIPSAAPVENETVGQNPDDVIAKDELQIETPSAKSEIPSAVPVEDEAVGLNPDENGSINGSSVHQSVSSVQETKATISPALVKHLREETGAGMMDCKKALAETGGDIVKAQEFLRKKGLASAEKKASRATAEGRIGSYIHDSRIGVLIEVNCETDFVSRGDIIKELVDDLAMQVAACPQVQYLVTEDVPEEIVSKEREIEMQKEDLLSKPEQIRSKIVEGRIRKRLEELALLEQPFIKNDKMVVKDWVKQTISTIGENIKVKRFVRYNLGEGLEKKSQDFAAEVAAQTAAKPVEKDQPASVETKETVQKAPAVTVSAALVKQLREETGAGMMDCKKALSETGGDLEKAQEYLRKKGLSNADKKSSRLAAEGRIGSYIHDTRIGVLVEVNCETDFVGRSEKFKELVDDLAMQIVACPQVQFVSIEDISEDIIKKEKELEMQREDLLSKPENIREKIVEGRVSKRLGELALLEQPFIKDDSILVKDLVKQTVAALGENIKVRRFVRFTLGEGSEDTKPETEA